MYVYICQIKVIFVTHLKMQIKRLLLKFIILHYIYYTWIGHTTNDNYLVNNFSNTRDSLTKFWCIRFSNWHNFSTSNIAAEFKPKRCA